MSKVIFTEISTTPPAPSAGQVSMYVKTDEVLYIQDSAGVEIPLGSATSITSLTGEATATGPGAAAVTLTNSAVIGKVLTGFTPGPNSPVSASDTILQAFQKLQAQSTATSGSAITALTGDVSATGPGSVAATVNTVGGSSASNIHSAELAANAATNANTPSTIIKRDASGNFAAGTMTGNITGSSTSFTGSLSGDITGTQSATVISATSNTTLTSLSNLSTVGTIALGTWSATPIAVNKGGTGQTSYTDGQLLIGNSTGNTLTKSTLTAGTGINITNGSGAITIAGNNISPTTSKTANYSIQSTDGIIFCDTSGGSFTLTLPNPATLAGKIFRIVGTAGTMQANPITLAPFGSEKIEGLTASKLLQTNWGGWQVTTNGTDWFLI